MTYTEWGSFLVDANTLTKRIAYLSYQFYAVSHICLLLTNPLKAFTQKTTLLTRKHSKGTKADANSVYEFS